MKQVTLTKEILESLAYCPEDIEHMTLRSDIENDILVPGDVLRFEGEVGNDQSFDLTWAIDIEQEGGVLDSYLYSSQYEYDKDVAFLTKITK
jgi:hypothetical protein